MSSKRISERNRINENIRITKVYMNKDSDTIQRLSDKDATSDFNLKKINTMKEQNEKRQTTINELEQRLYDLNNGDLDNELENNYKENTDNIENKKYNTKVKKINDRQEKQYNIDKSKEYLNKEKELDRKSRYDNRNAEKGFKHYLNACDTVPEYMLKKLKNMPNNKGYIWRDVHCYGELPAEKNKPVFLFENKKNLTIIHEITENEIKIWHKTGNSKNKELISSTPRRNKIDLQFSLLN